MFGGSQKGGFQKGGCSFVPKLPPKSLFLQCYPGRKKLWSWNSWIPKPERGYIRRNRPLTKPPFCFLSICSELGRRRPNLGGEGLRGLHRTNNQRSTNIDHNHRQTLPHMGIFSDKEVGCQKPRTPWCSRKFPLIFLDFPLIFLKFPLSFPQFFLRFPWNFL